MNKIRLIQIVILLLIVLTATGCGTVGAGSGAAAAAERYFQALAAGDENQLVDASCAAWEESARVELGSFTAVSVELEEMVCQEDSQVGEVSIVTCTGSIVANYGNEVLEIDLSERSYEVVSEGGEWRLCGYR